MLRETHLRPAALLLFAVVVFWPFLSAAFVSDDIFFAQLYRPESVTGVLLGAWPHSMGRTDGWRPVVLVSYWLNAALTDGSPAAYRGLNVLVHGTCAALLAHVVWGLTRLRLAAWVAGGLFVVHPVLHENVIWISGRTYPIAAAFALALSAWTLGRDRRSWRVQHAVGAVLLTGALASYEFAVVVPAALALLVVASYPGPVDRHALARAARFTAPYVALLVAYFAFRWGWLSDLTRDVSAVASGAEVLPGTSLPLRVIRNAGFFALKVLAWPWFDRGSDIRPGLVGTVTSVVAATSLAVAMARAETRRPAIVFIGWIGVFFLPVAAYAAIADRFAYLSAAALCGLIGLGAAVVAGRQARTLALPGAALLAVMTAGWTWDLRARGADWIQAGVLSERVVAAALAVEPGPSEPTDLHFVGVPRRHGAALALITYFPQAVWMRYSPAAQRQVQFVMSWESPEAVLRRVGACHTARATRVYAWQPERDAMQLLLDRPGGACAHAR